MESLLSQKESMTIALQRSELDLKEILLKEKELIDLKSRFITTASHEFRTPLSSILSSAEIIEILLFNNQPEKIQKHIARIVSSVGNLTSILEEFLSLSKLEEGFQTTRIEHLNPNPIINKVIESFSPSLKKGQKIIFKNINLEIFLETDEHILHQVLLNIFSNASKYSNEYCDIICKLQRINNFIEIEIIDHGIGIPTDDLPHLFTRFFRATNAINIPGTGLGLNIIQRLLELIEGRIKVASTLHRGTTFTIKLPIKNNYEKNFSY